MYDLTKRYHFPSFSITQGLVVCMAYANPPNKINRTSSLSSQFIPIRFGGNCAFSRCNKSNFTLCLDSNPYNTLCPWLIPDDSQEAWEVTVPTQMPKCHRMVDGNRALYYH
jgi:hypothetical protein